MQTKEIFPLSNKIVKGFCVKFYLIFIFFILLFLSNCSKGNGTDYKENYESRVLLLYLVRATPDPQGKCVEASTSAGKCIYVAKDKLSAATFLSEEAYSATILGMGIQTNTSTYAEFCTQNLVSATYKNYSEEAKTCNFSCQKEYWDKQSTETCSATNTQDLFKGMASGTITCIKNCLKVTNNSL